MYDQPEEEVQAQIGEGSHGEFVMAWFDAVLEDRNWTIAMQFMTEEFRRAFAEPWAEHAELTGELLGLQQADVVEALAAVDVEHPCWDTFAAASIGWHLTEFGDLADNLAIGSRPRPIALDVEGFNLVDYRQVGSPEVEIEGVPRRIVDERPLPPAVVVVVHSTPLGPRIDSWSKGPSFPGEQP